MHSVKAKNIHQMLGHSSLIKHEYSFNNNKKSIPNIIISDFRSDVGEIADIISFNKEFLGREFLSDKQKEAYYAVWGEKGGEWSKQFHEIVLLIGMKGGKNFWAEADLIYTIYFISCLRDPHKYFSKICRRNVPFTKDKAFDIINVSSSGEHQASQAFFESVKRVIRGTRDPKTGENWFEKYIKLDISDRSKAFKRREIIFPTMRNSEGSIRIMSFSSSPRSPEGFHMLRYYCDELSRADTEPKYNAACELYKLGVNNTRMSFPGNVGKVLAWSYPNNTDYDLTFEKYEESFHNPTIFGMKVPSYEFNPALDENLLKQQKEKDPIEFSRVYECSKSHNRNSFFSPHNSKIDDIISSSLENRVRYTIIEKVRKTEIGTNNEKENRFTGVRLDSIKGDHKTRCFAFDPSSNRDRFVILGGYPEIRDASEEDLNKLYPSKINVKNIRPVIDIIIVIEPIPGAPIDNLSIGEIFSEIIEKFPMTYSINSDHYQSDKLRQEIIKEGITSTVYHFSAPLQRELYTELRSNIWNNNIKVCSDPTRIYINKKQLSVTDLILREGHQLIDLGNKIDHPRNGSKDIFDALAILNHDIMKLELGIIDMEIESMTRGKLDKTAMAMQQIINKLFNEDRFIKVDKVVSEINKELGIPERVIWKILTDEEYCTYGSIFEKALRNK